jgi:hypothetical protein
MKEFMFQTRAQTWVPGDEKSPQASLYNQGRWGDQKELGKKSLPVGRKWDRPIPEN